MPDTLDPIPTRDISRLLESARRLGIEVNEQEAVEWLEAMTAVPGAEISIDLQAGVFGHRIAMLDFSPNDLQRFRSVGKLVEFEDVPGVVETALALSGSAAQSKIQTYPGDCDFFERVNIIAGTRSEACQILADLMRRKVEATWRGSLHQLIEIKFGSYPQAVKRGDSLIPKGAPIAWTPEEVLAGKIAASTPGGDPVEISWQVMADQPGWCKLDWVIADPVRGVLANASNMLDVTWEAPDGSITPLDGYLDPYFQEIYLDAQSVPIFSKLSKHVSGNALEEYVAQLEKEVNKYLTKDVNYGKAAKRMYNVFRLTGKYEEAAFLRELFDEPTTLLYQVWSLIRTIDDCFSPGSSIPLDQVLAQADNLVLAVVRALEGEKEEEVVRYMLRLRDSLTRQESGQELTQEAEIARAEVINLVNNFFYDRLKALPTIKAYIEGIQAGH